MAKIKISTKLESVAAIDYPAQIKELKVTLKTQTKELRVKQREVTKLEKAVERTQTKLTKAELRNARQNGTSVLVEPKLPATKPKPAPKPAVAPKPTTSKPTTSKPKPSATDDKYSLKGRKFDPKVMKGSGWFKALNSKSSPIPGVEGYWRKKFNTELTGLPFPVIMPVKGYNRAAFVEQLEILQSKLRPSPERGFSPHRWTGKNNGISEYRTKEWKWPQGYITYVRAGVPPSRAFYKFVTGTDNPNLPTYGIE